MFTRKGLRNLNVGLLPNGASWDDYPRRLNVACGGDYREGWTNVDLYASRVDQRFDVFHPPYPFKPASFDYAACEQILEHVPPLIGTQDGLLRVLEELHRVLRTGGLLHMGVPYAGHIGDLENVTHYRRFVERSLDFLDPHRDDIGGLRSQTPARFRLRRRVVLRSIRFTRWFDSSFHLPKYLGLDPNLGRRRGLKFLLERLPDEAATKA